MLPDSEISGVRLNCISPTCQQRKRQLIVNATATNLLLVGSRGKSFERTGSTFMHNVNASSVEALRALVCPRK